MLKEVHSVSGKIHRVALLNPPWRVGDLLGVRAGSRWPHLEPVGNPYAPYPFFLGYASALLRRSGFETRLFDGIAVRRSDADFLDDVAAFAPDALIQEVSTPSWEVDQAFSRHLHERFPRAVLLLAGPHAHLFDEAVLAALPHVHGAFIGEYERTARELLVRLNAGADLEGTRGLLFRRADGRLYVNREYNLIDNLDDLPWPDRDSVDPRCYVDTAVDVPQPSLQVLASRGCPFQCSFCLWPQLMYGGNRYRARDPVRVVDEIEACAKRFGFRSFYFDDDTFNLGEERLRTLAAELERRKLGLPWSAMARADGCSPEVLRVLRDAGLVGIRFGIESGVQRLVDACGKALDLHTAERTIRAAKTLGLRVHLTFCLGLPGESWDTVRQTLAFARRLDPYSANFSIVTPFPGCRYHEELRRKGMLETEDFAAYDGEHRAVLRTDHLTADDLVACYHWAQRKWRRHCVWRDVRRHWPRLAARALRHPVRYAHRLKELLGD